MAAQHEHQLPGALALSQPREHMTRPRTYYFRLQASPSATLLVLSNNQTRTP